VINLFVCTRAGGFVSWTGAADIETTGAGDGVSGFDPPRAALRLPSESPHEKKRREAGEVASRRAEANTGNLFATELE
jgi:hypothetical protein